MRAEPKRCKELGLSVDGPLALLANKERHPRDDRFFNDPPEFFTVLRGPADGLHWGYWFDQPGELTRGPALFIEVGRLDQLLDDAELVVGVEDREVGLQTDEFGVAAQHPCGDGVEGPEPRHALECAS